MRYYGSGLKSDAPATLEDFERLEFERSLIHNPLRPERIAESLAWHLISTNYSLRLANCATERHLYKCPYCKEWFNTTLKIYDEHIFGCTKHKEYCDSFKIKN